MISARTPSLYGRALGREGRGREPEPAEAAADGVGERNEKRSLAPVRHAVAHDIPDPARARPVMLTCVAAVEEEVVRGAYAACAATAT